MAAGPEGRLAASSARFAAAPLDRIETDAFRDTRHFYSEEPAVGLGVKTHLAEFFVSKRVIGLTGDHDTAVPRCVHDARGDIDIDTEPIAADWAR